MKKITGLLCFVIVFVILCATEAVCQNTTSKPKTPISHGNTGYKTATEKPPQKPCTYGVPKDMSCQEVLEKAIESIRVKDPHRFVTLPIYNLRGFEFPLPSAPQKKYPKPLPSINYKNRKADNTSKTPFSTLFD